MNPAIREPCISRKPLPSAGSGAAVSACTHLSATPRAVLPGTEKPLTRERYVQGEAALRIIQSLPYFLSAIFLGRHRHLLETQGFLAANKWLVMQFDRRIWPRIAVVNQKNAMNVEASPMFMAEVDNYAHLPGMHDKALRQLASRIAGHLRLCYEDECEAYLARHGGDNTGLLDDETQTEFYVRVATLARVFNVTPMHWRKYRKGALDAASAVASLSRLTSEAWWERQLNAQRTRWREALLIAAGEVSLKKSPYASRHAIRDVQTRRQSNMDYLSGCELENIDTGERFDLLDKVMASISNPEIRRMELMNTIAGIETYAAEQRHVGMFITLTTPSKYHPTRTAGPRDDRVVQFNHNWDAQAYSPKDAQRYLVRIWSRMRTAFKDNGLSVYGMRVVEPHHDGTPHWHMMLFCERSQRKDVIDLMRRYALKEDGDERGAARNRFEAKHMNKGGAAGYIAKYIAKNIDGYALDGEIDHETGQPLRDMASAVTAWASTWRIPQFKPIGVPTMGAYRECRASCLRGISLADSFDQRVEAVRAAADAGDFAAYIASQGGANVPRDVQTVRVARKVAAELNAFDEEVEKVIGIYAPHLGADRVRETRTTQWRIVRKAVDVDRAPLTLKSASGAPRSPVNNCGEGQPAPGADRPLAPPECLTAVMGLIEQGEMCWDDAEAIRALRASIRAPSGGKIARVASPQRQKIPTEAPIGQTDTRGTQAHAEIRIELARQGITPERWELTALA